MTHLAETIPFEIHITIENVTSQTVQVFQGLCNQLGGKAILIELSRGEHISQPMFTKVFSTNNIDEVFSFADRIIRIFTSDNFQYKRLKIEIPVTSYALFTKTYPDLFCYFEWHGRIKYHDPELLTQLCNSHHAHLSRNALKSDPERRFITLREHSTIAVFVFKIEQLLHTLNLNNYFVEKQQSECCIFDSKEMLDAGWLL